MHNKNGITEVELRGMKRMLEFKTESARLGREECRFKCALVGIAFIVIGIIMLAAQVACADQPRPQLRTAIAQQESSGNINAEGDKNLRLHAYGIYQIRQWVCDDVNDVCGTTYRAEDCKGNLALSDEIMSQWYDRWATKQHVGHKPIDADFATMWNGGPKGCFTNGVIDCKGTLAGCKFKNKAKALHLQRKVAAEQKRAWAYWTTKIRPKLDREIAAK